MKIKMCKYLDVNISEYLTLMTNKQRMIFKWHKKQKPSRKTDKFKN